MKITIIGCGNMGLTYAKAFLKYNLISKKDLLLVEKNESRKNELIAMNMGEACLVNDSRIAESNMVILAVKPQDFFSLCVELKKVLSNKNCIVSIMAGVTIQHIKDTLKQTCIIRAMPNSPAELGMGMTAFTADSQPPIEQIRMVEKLLTTTGKAIFLESEELLDAVTALSGSGPAYFFYIVKNMIEAGVKMGLDEVSAALFVKQTMLGSFHLVNNANKSLDELIKAVASKGGTTEAALSTFEKNKTGLGLQEGILRARDRATELAK